MEMIVEQIARSNIPRCPMMIWNAIIGMIVSSEVGQINIVSNYSFILIILFIPVECQPSSYNRLNRKCCLPATEKVTTTCGSSRRRPNNKCQDQNQSKGIHSFFLSIMANEKNSHKKN